MTDHYTRVQNVLKELDAAGDPGMYICRPVVNQDELIVWAAEHGLVLDPDPHVTVAFSKKTVPVDLRRDEIMVGVESYGLLGKHNALVLYVPDQDLQERWLGLIRAGATWDFDSYSPHVTICYFEDDVPESVELEVPPFPIVLGPERQELLKTLYTAKLEKYNPNHRPAGTRQGGQFAPKTGTGYSLVNGTWQKADGTPASAATIERLKEIGAAGGYKDIRLNPDRSHYLQALATDAKGRRKGFYKAEYVDGQKQAKFKRNEQFHKARPGILAAIEDTLQDNSASPQMKEAALVLKLIDRTGFRPGSDRNTKAEKKAYGATTLTARHVKIDGNKLSFNFTGKKGVKITKTLVDAELADALRPRVKEGGHLFNATGAHLKQFLTHHGYGKFMPKDFRTWNGTSKALETIKKMPVPKNATQYKRAVKAVSTVVAKHLGNTPAMAFNSYINPRVWSKWPPLAPAKVSKMADDLEKTQRDMDELFEDSVTLPGPTADLTDTEIEEFLAEDSSEDDEEDEGVEKYNHNHGKDGRFTSGTSELAMQVIDDYVDLGAEEIVDGSFRMNAKNREQAHIGLSQFFPKMTEAQRNRAIDDWEKDGSGVEKVESTILKTDDDQRVVWGWASVATVNGELVRDHQNDVVTPEDLQKTAHDFMMNHRVNARMHKSLEGEGEPIEKVQQTGAVVESVMFTKELQDILGIDLGMEAWLIGVKVTCEDTWQQVKKGELRAFSIGGSAERVPLEKFNPNHHPAGSGKGGQFAPKGSGGGFANSSDDDLRRERSNLDQRFRREGANSNDDARSAAITQELLRRSAPKVGSEMALRSSTGGKAKAEILEIMPGGMYARVKVPFTGQEMTVKVSDLEPMSSGKPATPAKPKSSKARDEKLLDNLQAAVASGKPAAIKRVESLMRRAGWDDDEIKAAHDLGL